jgi:hypothetical protein
MDEYENKVMATKKDIYDLQDRIALESVNMHHKFQEICPHKSVTRLGNTRYYTCSLCGKGLWKNDVPKDSTKVYVAFSGDEKDWEFNLEDIIEIRNILRERKENAKTEIKNE